MTDEKKRIEKFTDLKAWQASRQLVLCIYSSTSCFPNSEEFGLTSQMKRAAVSVSSNIAEGFNRATMKDRLHFYVMAHGSLTEVQSQVMLSRDLKFMRDASFREFIDCAETAEKLLVGLIKATKERL